jgi:hypothetical protein
MIGPTDHSQKSLGFVAEQICAVRHESMSGLVFVVSGEAALREMAVCL